MTTTAVTKHYIRPNRNGKTKESEETTNRKKADEKLKNFFQAIKDGNVEKVKKILDENSINVNTVFLPDDTYKPRQIVQHQRIGITGGNDYVDLHSNLPGNSPLHLAAAEGNDEICRVLISDWYADVDIRNHNGDTPLHCAARESCEKTCQLLLQDGHASVNLKNDIGESPLHLAAIADAVEVCRVLIRDGKAKVDVKNKVGSTPLHRAVDQNHPDVCKILIKEGKADVNLQNNWGSPLHRAAGHDHTEICRTAGHDCTDICQILIKDGHADVNIRNKFGDTPLYKAAYKKNLEACRILIEDGDAKVNRWNKVRDTPLHAAAEQNGAEVCQLLIQVGKANVDIKNKVGNTPLHCALKSGRTHARVAKVLLEVGDADTGIKNQEGKTALGYKIVGRQNSEIIKTAIKNVTNHKKMVAEEDCVEKVKLFMCGNNGVGKTTLGNSMTKGFWSSLKTSNKQPTDTYCPTPGIQVKSKHIKGAGDFSIWDMAGQMESHLTHAMFLSKSKGIFILVYDITGPDMKPEEQLHYWLRFLKAGHDAAETKPEVVIVGTHLDVHGNIEYAQTTAQSLLDGLVMQYGEFLNIHKESIVLDARQSGRQMDILKATLGKLAQPMRGGEMPRICRKIAKAMGQWPRSNVPLLTWTEFVENVQLMDPLAEEDLIKKAVGFLHDSGKLFHAKLADHDDVLILDIEWLTSKIFTPIFGKHDLRLPNPGLKNQQEYTLKELIDQIKMHDAELPVALLKHFELAYSYIRCDMETFVIPAKLPPGVRDIDWQPDPTKNARYTGFRIECKDDTDMFAVDVFPCVQSTHVETLPQTRQGTDPVTFWSQNPGSSRRYGATH
ncbi:uncharacterized protein [Amphiura filiformis]|uniref:uncharacterized protein n=1 Tax=Amphiura filiformis TaxID=82378 RepID=UPI003B20D787